MTMLFRRTLDHLKERSWGAAAFEFVLVVVGIFLALQVDNWNEERKDRIDERRFMQRLHGDVMRAEELTNRVRERRLSVLGSLNAAANVLFGRNERAALDDAECRSIGVSSFFSVSVSPLPSLAELSGTGRMGIIRDAELRTALVGLQQVQDALEVLIPVQTSTTVFLTAKYPTLIEVESYVEQDSGEVRLRYECDTSAMRANRAFLNDLATNADTFDVFVRDGLAPWFGQLDTVHSRVDAELGVEHD